MRWLSVAALLLSACTGPSEDEELTTDETTLIGGTITSDYPAVVALVSGDFAYCTGTLVSPRVVVTAAHCIDATSSTSPFVYFGDDAAKEGKSVAVVRLHKHPEWAGDINKGKDIGLLLLDKPQDPDLPMPIHTTQISIGAQVRRVGFGIHVNGGEADGKKRMGTTFVSAITADVFETDQGDITTCSGDSGGPVIVTSDGVERIVGVHSYGLKNSAKECVAGGDGSTRMDVYYDAYVAPFVARYDLSCGADWYCYPNGCANDPDCQPCGADGTCTQGCALPDPDCPTASLGEICQRDSQCKSGLCVGWSEVPSSKFCSQSCGICPSGMTCQSRPGFGNICYYDEAPEGIIGSECTEDVECGSYNCDQGVCAQACDLAVGKGCPNNYQCTDVGGRFNCLFAPEGGGGGCMSSRTSVWLLFLLLLVAPYSRRALSF